MTPDALRWLLTDEANDALASVAGEAATPALVAALRTRLGGEATHAAAVLELAELRSRGVAKFAQAQRMFFTRKGYEQATDEHLARYKAERFRGAGVVVDACCGVGGDLIGLARVAGRCLGVDADPVVAAFAQRNAAVHGHELEIAPQELDATNLPDGDAWHADPDRRPAGRRTSQPDRHDPSLGVLDAWRERTPAAAVKLAPAARLPEAWCESVEREWISRGGECRQLIAWCGPLAGQAGACVATRLDADGLASTFVGEPDAPLVAAERLGDWLHEPDPAVLAAGLTGALASHHGLHAATSPLPYLTSDAPVEDPLVASFRVIGIMPLDRKRLAGWLRERSVGRLEIKCRGVDLRPEALRRELKPKGSEGATLLVFPNQAGKLQAVIAERREALGKQPRPS
ncbi:hypothetical protein MalM25_21450 [Planctomycetes bacterium MalM25]|nr:hypothetical protein MalM25_21450 [Planctomycetes bacterium MalM25]